MTAPSQVTTEQVFAIAGPAMIANLTTPLIGIVSTIAIGRLGDATLLGGVAMASVIFDCLFWLFAFLRMSTLAFTAQALGAGETLELPALLVRGLVVAALVGGCLIGLQIPLATALFAAMGGSEGVTRAAKIYFAIRIWSAPLALANYVVLGWLVGQARATLALRVQVAINLINMVATMLLVLVLDLGIAGAAIAAVVAEAAGLLLGIVLARRLTRGKLAIPRVTLFNRAKLMRMLSVNRDIMIRTAALISAFLFFTAQGARRRRDARSQRGSQQLPPRQRLLPRRSRKRRRAALRPRLWRARQRRLLRGDPAGGAVGFRLCAGRDRGLRVVRHGADRSDDRERSGAARRARLSVVCGAGAGARGVRLRL
jgi:MATE family multidrug resistance protein